MAHILAGLEVESYDRSYSDSQLVRRITTYFRPFAWRIGVIILAIVLNAALNALFPVLLSQGIDNLQAESTGQGIALLLASILGVGVVAWGFDVIQKWQSSRVVSELIFEIRKHAFRMVTSHDMSFFDARSPGEVVSRISADTDTFGGTVTMTINVLSQFLLFVILLGVLFSINLELALITLLLAALIVVVTLVFRKIARRLARIQQRSLARLNASIEETVSGIVIAKNFRQELAIYGDLTKANDLWYRATLGMNVTYTGIFPFLLMLTGFGTVAIVYAGGHSLMAGQLSAGEWFLFLQCVLLFWSPLTSIASFWSQFQQGLAAGERVFSLIDAESKVVQIDRQPVQQLTGQIVFEQVTFSYTEREMVLNNFSLTINAGESVALVGHTGAGKSSLARLVARFYEFQSGRLRIDGRDIRTLDLDAYRRHVGIVPQMPFLFSGTVADNIRYGRPDVSDAAIEAAAYQIANGDWLAQLPRGLHTSVGERGSRLSTGQRQLVALARVVLQNPAIVILDEATASIDPLTEALIQEGLDTILAGRTAIVIAHRLPTIRKASRIIVIDRGTIIEQGSHAELIEQQGHYAELYRLYFQHQMPDYRLSQTAAA